MATKVDRTASMMCRRHGCSSEKLAERVIELEAAIRWLREAYDFDFDTLVHVRRWLGETEGSEKGKSAD